MFKDLNQYFMKNITRSKLHPKKTSFLIYTLLLFLFLPCFPSLKAETTKGISRTHNSRVALLIGNGNYPDAPLRNPVNDARTMGGLLQKAGFEVTVLENIGKREFVMLRLDLSETRSSAAMRKKGYK